MYYSCQELLSGAKLIHTFMVVAREPVMEIDSRVDNSAGKLQF